MSETIRKHTVLSCCVIFAVLILVHGIEAIVIKTDETVLGENCINKIFGILVIFVILRILGWKWSKIGFTGTGFFKNIGNKITLPILLFIINIYYCIQFVYFKIFGSLFSVSMMGMGGTAVGNFFWAMEGVLIASIIFLTIFLAIMSAKNSPNRHNFFTMYIFFPKSFLFIYKVYCREAFLLRWS